MRRTHETKVEQNNIMNNDDADDDDDDDTKNSSQIVTQTKTKTSDSLTTHTSHPRLSTGSKSFNKFGSKKRKDQKIYMHKHTQIHTQKAKRKE